ncbi:NAD-dependent epimerase/dehydratase family protein [Chlorogloea sp. CCALA 695]|uniref:NAD-dependent epimerase/dehydratase family protein n=1 Tax=Chlorogloea sp. CCALA 695 TaxID=2107693 RepID=UPI000D061D58|nr:NAD-dependent epimerase/dehydratase family protein [Chlorogloea sp. CCALA 695]PSB29703.1 epimerase [Chlorogloea sp. CCALA 695]
MKALVTGANGFTGSHLVKVLVNNGDRVIGLVRKSSNLDRLANCDIELVYGDITDSAALQQAISGVDVVFHTAAYVEIGIVNEKEMERVNVEGTRTVLEVAKACNVSKIVYCSTIGIFGDTGGQAINEGFKRTQQGFSSAYDRTKYLAQELVDSFASQGLPVVSILPSGIFGADDPHFRPILQQFINRKLKLWAGGSRVTGIVHVDDLAAAMILAAEKGINGDKYIISAGDLTTKEMFATMASFTGIPAPREAPKWLVRLAGNLLDPLGRLFKFQPPLSRERVHYIYDRCVRVYATKARTELDWQPRSVTETLKELVTL